MANTQSLCGQFKVDLLNGIHAFSAGTTRATTAADTFKGALYLASATYNASTTNYQSTGEIGNSGSYSAGGATVTWISPAAVNPAAVGPATTIYTTLNASISFTSFTATAFDTLLIYNSSKDNRSVSVHTFSPQSITLGTFTLTMPTNDGSTGLLRLI